VLGESGLPLSVAPGSRCSYTPFTGDCAYDYDTLQANEVASMALFEWTEEQSVSIARFDSDHKKLFAMLNEMNEAMAQGRGRLTVVSILKELADYANWHFAAEETAMRRANFAGLEEHIAEHREMMAKVQDFYGEFSSNSYALPIDVLYFMRDWLQHHILSTDRKYGEALNRAGIH
jgi:hemerythrin